MKKIIPLAFLGVLALLAACGSDDDSSADDTGNVSDNTEQKTDVATQEPGVSGGTTGTNLFPWNRYFVTEFSPAEVQRIRNMPGFKSNDLRYTMPVIAGHPIYDGSGKIIESNPQSAARLDYALSTGLSGTGQIVSIMDDGIRLTHEQFAGKTIHISGNPPAAGDMHGTAVASVAAGSGNGGGTIGFAPAADLHLGYFDLDAPVNWQTLGNHMRRASDIGAIVSNNSWGLFGVTVDDVDPSTFFQSSRRAPYIDGLRQFAKDGVVVFALQNDYTATSASLMASIPLGVPSIEGNWISVVNAIPEYDDEAILSAERVSTACLETARFCMTANGQIRVAAEGRDNAYEIGSGTSFAAPQVSGSLALLAEAFSDLSATQLRDRLLATADNGFFTHSGTVEFAPGIIHGYNEEFGHGFLDLRSALLPIGDVVIPMANGDSLAVGSAAISSGSASGDALAQSLASMNVVSLDQLHGSFTTSGDILANATGGINVSTNALTVATQPDVGRKRASFNEAIQSGKSLAGHQIAQSDPSGAEFLGGTKMPLLVSESGFELAALDGNVTTGLVLSQDFDLGGGTLRLGVASMRTRGSVMGVTVPRFEDKLRSTTHAIKFDLASRIGTKTVLRFNGEMGSARGNGAGMVTEFSNLSYNRFGLAVERADVTRRGDVLSLIARRPIGITRGVARMELPTQFANGVTDFSSRDVNLAPSGRQFDLGFEYAAPISRGGSLTVGMMHSSNYGNITGRRSTSGFVGMQLRM